MTTEPFLVSRVGRLRLPSLCLITDRRRVGDASMEDVILKAVEGGVSMVQVREKDLPAGELFALANSLRQATHGRALLIVNDRLDVAQATGADGLHLPENGLSVAIARWLLGRNALIGRSVHSVEAAVEAEKDGADYVQVGTIFQGPSKAGPEAGSPQAREAKPAGTALIEAVTRTVSIPVLAVGGVNAKNVAKAIEAGANGASVISAIMDAKDPKATAESLVKAMNEVWKARTVDAKSA